jgi:hypothetical protein
MVPRSLQEDWIRGQGGSEQESEEGGRRTRCSGQESEVGRARIRGSEQESEAGGAAGIIRGGRG